MITLVPFGGNHDEAPIPRGLALGVAAFAVPAWAEGDMDVAALAKALQQGSLPLEKATKLNEREG
jgi:hypothetical protein